MTNEDRSTAFEDYRNSHKGKGADYDETVLSTPFDAYMDRWEAHRLMPVLAHLFPNGIPRYLDFACGTGRITRRIESLAAESCGVDVSESMLGVARRKCPATRFVCADLTRCDLESGPFDLVTAFRFFGNAQDELRSAALVAINRRLRPGGYLVLNNHRNPISFLGLARRLATGADEMDLSHGKLRRLLREHGFEIANQCAIGFWIFRFKRATAELLESSRAARMENLFRSSWFVPLAPDALVVARKTALS